MLRTRSNGVFLATTSFSYTRIYLEQKNLKLNNLKQTTLKQSANLPAEV